ncbi:DUF262 domain-containing protein [Brachyspira catarrhinii]|uniref:DUF262 domain-containing protein n=1 Tax=Brachyspira catarrhinii TaxID=2528966 RepID=A0ABY2TNQ3_9SPIR|nr:DUF262 domain-containing protein [Brachyspira catarrhinii]TKZ30083.1 DUF262 domain-containing protein [Brachyspira catarrhinii]
MEAKEKNFKEIMINEKKFIIPFFQRHYVWGKEDWERLFNDLYDSFKNNKDHFLGSIILKRSLGNDNFANVIDGQQRLTTFSILFKILYDKLDDEDKEDYISCLYQKPLKQRLPIIQHSMLDIEKYNELFTNNDINKGIKEGIIGCHNFFVEKVKEAFNDNIKQIHEFLDFIYERKVWITVSLNANEDEQKIFDSINSTGEPLNATDIIKNALFDKTIKIIGETEATKWYKKYWGSIFEKDNTERSFWDKKTTIGRIKRAKSEIFFHAFAIIEGFFDPNKHNLQNMSLLYKEHTKNFGEQELKNFFEDILKYSEIYRKFPIYNKESLFSFEKWEDRFFHIIEQTKTNTVLPLILILKDKLNCEKETLKECLYILEIFILCNKENKNYNKFFVEVVKDLPKENNEIASYLKNKISNTYELNKQYVEKLLKNINNNNTAKIILFWIELHREDKEKDFKDKTELKYIYTLEHLMPQKWQTHWVEVGKNSDNAKKLIYQIGNMTLLKNKLNATIQNQTWDIKLNGNKKVKHFIKKSADLLINKELINEKGWNEKTIEDRTKLLTKEFFEIWNVDIFENK